MSSWTWFSLLSTAPLVVLFCVVWTLTKRNSIVFAQVSKLFSRKTNVITTFPSNKILPFLSTMSASLNRNNFTGLVQYNVWFGSLDAPDTCPSDTFRVKIGSLFCVWQSVCLSRLNLRTRTYGTHSLAMGARLACYTRPKLNTDPKTALLLHFTLFLEESLCFVCGAIHTVKLVLVFFSWLLAGALDSSS